MRSFQRSTTLDPVPGALVRLLAEIDRSAGSEAQSADQVPELLTHLARSAIIESVTASSAIEGIHVGDQRRPGLATGAITRYRNRSEAEFAGYRDGLDYVYRTSLSRAGADRSTPGPLSVGFVLHLHRLLFAHTDGAGGRLKLHDNVVVERGPDGQRQIRFTPVSATETPHYLAELVERTNQTLADKTHHPLLVVSGFALDLSCIHPFGDGNGRIARLATAFLLQETGYGVGRYISIEQLILDTKDEYYAALGASTAGWFDDGRHQVWPWTMYLCERLAEAYRRFNQRITAESVTGSKQERVRSFALDHGPTKFSRADIRRALPGISDPTIRLVLAELRDEGRIVSDGAGRSSVWIRLESPKSGNE